MTILSATLRKLGGVSRLGELALLTTLAAACGSGESAQYLHCLPGGTVSVDGTCPVVCGAGTQERNGACVPSGSSCGPGTVASGDQCVPQPRRDFGYEVRTLLKQFPADGRTKIPIFASGQESDGTPSLREGIFFPSRSDVGSLLPARRTLTALGATSYFVPCDAAVSPSCLGPFQIKLALAEDPSSPVATSANLDMIAQQGVGSPAACLGGGNVLFFDGDSNDWVYPGLLSVTRGQWGITATSGELPSTINVALTPSSTQQGRWWNLEFSSRQLNQPLETKVYENAERSPFATSGHPGVDIGGDGRGCNTIAGRFQVYELTMAGSTVKRFTAAFEQHCEAHSTMLRGCVHYEQ